MAKQIVLIHGAWLTPRSWESFEQFFKAKGYEVLLPEWPRKADGVEAQRRDPSKLAGLGIKEIVDHHEAFIRQLPEPPVIVGHSFGGLFTQILLDRGLGSGGVAMDPGPPKGIFNLPLAALVSASPVLLHPSKWSGIIELSLKQFTRGFVNTWSPEDAKHAYERYAVPETGRILFQAGTANFKPGSEATVNWKNPSRAPLLITGGTKDNTVPAALSRSIYKKYKASPARTDYLELDRPHLLMAGEGWEEVAESVGNWIESVSVPNTAPAEASVEVS
jgi:pimeloyl-ACP methyl ester carboxylesterase